MKATRKYQGVTAFIGMPGSGKTYGLAEVAKRDMERGRTVYSNAGFDVQGSKTFSSFEDFLAIPNGSTVVWDELPIYVNARKWSEFPDGVFYRLTQIRKDSLRFYYSAIDESMVDVNVRRLTFWFWHCQAITGRLLRRTLWPPERYRKAKAKPYRRELVIVREPVARLYDTHGKVLAPLDAPTARETKRWTGAGDRPAAAGSRSRVAAAAAPRPVTASNQRQQQQRGRPLPAVATRQISTRSDG